MNGCVSQVALLFCSNALAGSFYNSTISMDAFAAPQLALWT
jgi:hypothetical protein